MANSEKKTAFCPNCQQPAIKQGNQIICEKCDATYTISKTGAAKVKEIGRIEKIEQDILDIKAQLSPEEPGPDNETEPPEESESDEGNGDW